MSGPGAHSDNVEKGPGTPVENETPAVAVTSDKEAPEQEPVEELIEEDQENNDTEPVEDDNTDEA